MCLSVCVRLCVDSLKVQLESVERREARRELGGKGWSRRAGYKEVWASLVGMRGSA